MQKRRIVNSPGVLELKRKRHKILKTKIIFYICGLIIFVVAIALLSRIKKINISEINVTGNVIIDSKLIEDVAKDNLSGNYLWVFPKTNFLIYPKKQILKDLTSKYKRLKSVSLTVVNFRTIEIRVSEYEGKYLYCGEVTPLLDSRSEQDCYFIDSKGYIFDKAPFFSGDVYFKFFGKINGGNSGAISGNYYYPNIFPNLITFKENIAKMNLKPLDAWINPQNEIYISLSTLGVAPLAPSIILRLDSNYEKMAENLQAAITTEPLLSKLKNHYALLNYIDLRFGNKVYYKFK